MNFALSQRRTDRHPVGLMIVVGLHVLVAAALLSARLKSPPPEPPAIILDPLQPVVKVEPKPVDLPKVQTQPLKFKLEVPVPDVVVDRTEPTLQAVTADNHPPVDPTIVVARLDVPVAPQAHVAARPAVVNAGAAGCRPVYPVSAQRAEATGVSRIRFTVDAAGHIAAAQILQSSGPTREHRLMDKAAADALAQCPAKPGLDEAGHAVGGTADVEYVWTLN